MSSLSITLLLWAVRNVQEGAYTISHSELMLQMCPIRLISRHVHRLRFIYAPPHDTYAHRDLLPMMYYAQKRFSCMDVQNVLSLQDVTCLKS